MLARHWGRRALLSLKSNVFQCHSAASEWPQQDGPPIGAHARMKYCEDTRPKGQVEHAQTQHTELIANLKAQGCCAAVHLHVILIGVAGTIYIPHTLEPLKRLGLDHQHATQLACRLNAHSCACARKFAGTRYA